MKHINQVKSFYYANTNEVDSTLPELLTKYKCFKDMFLYTFSFEVHTCEPE